MPCRVRDNKTSPTYATMSLAYAKRGSARTALARQEDLFSVEYWQEIEYIVVELYKRSQPGAKNQRENNASDEDSAISAENSSSSHIANAEFGKSTPSLQMAGPIEPANQVSEPHKLIINDVVLNRIDKIYHEKIVGKDDPLDILKTLRLAKTREVPTTTVSARHTLHTIKYEHTREKADEFIKRFEQIIRAHDNISGVVPISIAEKRDAIYQAIRIAYPGVQHANFLCQTHNQRELDYEELKKYIIERELDKLQNSDSDPQTALSAKKQRKFKPRNDAPFKPKCKVCHQNTSDHNERNCPWQGTGYKICYNCEQVVNHVAANCPMICTHQERRGNQSYRGHGRGFKRNFQPRQDDKKRHKTNTENSRGRGRGGRGRGRTSQNQQPPPPSNNQFPNSQGHMATPLPNNTPSSTVVSMKNLSGSLI
ncbi:hypothetical protein QAD02_002204 [Eretmocerus hayati]|uniref:Uncharacterized protein n=1 Tax=Eretmocerus hayati TaxID=131215 RepID=A0ACC2NI88_9HYME|nr:hypothetical protein QAD02_002204 [Eretmocerus hayati]